MRLPFSMIAKTGLASVTIWAVAGADCGSVNVLPFPKTAAWTQRTVNRGAGIRPAATAVTDFDGDSLADIAVGYPGTESVTASATIFFQTDVDNFTAVQLAQNADLSGLAAMVVADIDADGHSDVIAACNGRLVYLHSGADPRIAADWTHSTIDESTGDNVNQWNDVAVGDINGDGRPDIVACNADVGRVSWFQSPADPTSGTGWTRIDIDATTRTSAASVALEDLNGDGRLDVISTAPGELTARVAWYSNPTDPATDTWFKRTIGNLSNATRLTLADCDGDTRSDVVVTSPATRQIGWYVRPANPAGAWTGYQLTTFSANTPVDVKAADIDGNGQVDIVVATQQVDSLRWFTPIGSQTLGWGENNLQDLTESVGRIALGDIDGDGRPDVVAPLLATTTDRDSIAWFENPEP